jgi:trehalose/maltose hydrolase-like predicted phosphorylase
MRDAPVAPLLDRTFEAVVFTWHAAAADASAMAGLRRRVGALCNTRVHVVLIVEETDASDADESSPWSWAPDRLLVYRTSPGPNAEDAADVMRRSLARLGRRGLGPGLVLVIGGRFGAADGSAGRDAALLIPEAARACVVSVGPEPAGTPVGVRHLGGGPAMVRRLLDEQLDRRRQSRVGAVDEDSEWTIIDTGRDPLRHRVTETLFTLGAGGLATRGSVEERRAGSAPLVLATGVYTDTDAGPDQHLLPGPDWTGLSVDLSPLEDRRILDLRGGLLWREARPADPATPPLRTLRFASVTRPGVVVLRGEGPAEQLSPGPALRPPADAAAHGQMEAGRLSGRSWARVRARGTADAEPNGPGIVAVASQAQHQQDALRTVERIAAYEASTAGPPALDGAVAALEAAMEDGVDRMLAEHRAAWADRWEAVDVSIPADPAAQLAVRFALFQLWNNVDRIDEVAVGARGQSGTGYRGHVFWDADVYVLPAIASMSPAVARATLEYRLRRLPAARDAARATGRQGARFPWESAADGRDVTPTYGDLGGHVVPILTGTMEEHITADVAWAARHYAAWTGDADYLPGPGSPLLIETARYWASRCRLDADGRAHIDDVIGPDEYHEFVNDNAYTNVMARWNLRQGAGLAETVEGPTKQTRSWRDIADRLVDGYHPATGRYEQFAGYDKLEPLLVAEIGQPPLAADVLLGQERIARSQVIKQPDALMLHHLVPDEVEPGSLEPNVDFYAPRTAHGSSLSPAMMAALLARAGRSDEALRLLRIALFLDLDDVNGTTAGGLHLATMGGVWQAILMGFAGVGVRQGVLEVHPALPTAWPRLGLRFRCLGRHVRLDLTPEDVDVRVDGPLPVDVSGHEPQTVVDMLRLTYAGGRARRPVA